MGTKTLYVLKIGSGDTRSYLKSRYKDRQAAPVDDPEYPLEFTGVTDEAHIFQTYDGAYVFRIRGKYELRLFDVVGVNIIM